MKSWDAVKRRIEELCKAKNFSYYELSYKSAVPMSTIMHIIHGTTPTIKTIHKICNGFDITLKEFFSEEYFDNLEQEIS